MFVQFGCGMRAPPGWRNFDASPTLRFERLWLVGRLYKKNAARFPACVEYGDIVSGLPLQAGTCEAIYCSHVLEHLALDDFRRALRNTYRYLQQGGIFRLVMPDLRACARAYLADESPQASISFLSATGLGLETSPRSVGAIAISMLGNSRHLWLWDYEATAWELAEVGFRNIHRVRYRDSAIARFKEVEDEERWNGCLGVECIR
jgi:SAM-dependent methyltransferase